VLKRAFDFGYRDRPFHENPALNLRCARPVAVAGSFIVSASMSS